ncbi:hypothetical protein B4589_014855 [Halolamina sp. CBA1230]|uniref:DUF5827 family protein n=1 Tax=Halolamina sp. CBA1230 TaxID=1853690 RepID=UPI0009A23F28|nr:DUF5827 family protein [Halolamina sp. CBA1230]QKY21592.1 hypothetical protein B4589_014855 [Halolamina sp. CBA1230]
MPRDKESFDALHPCDFYTPEELLVEDQMYTIYEIARLLQGLDPGAEIDEETESVLLDWAVPWVMTNADELVVADPPEEDAPGYYGLRRPADAAGSGTEHSEPTDSEPSDPE